MIQLKLHNIWNMIASFRDLETSFQVESRTPDAPLTERERSALFDRLRSLKSLCESFELNASMEMVDNAFQDNPRTAREVASLFGIAKSELKARFFFFVPTRRAKFFGREVSWASKFPTAASDMREAATCFATGLDTACVFHLMRTLEIGIRVLALDAGVVATKPLIEQNWNTILESIESEIRAKAKGPGGASANPKVLFWADAATQFFAFKDAWRNQTMHVKTTYTEHQASVIFSSVDVFMTHLATQLNE